MNRRIAGLVLLLAVSLVAACNNSNAPVQTNANTPRNLNANSAPSNVGVMTNNNGNDNTAGVKPINANNSNNSNNSNQHPKAPANANK